MPEDITSAILKPGVLILVGVSGGPDSLALMHYLHNRGYPLIVASFNHQLRRNADTDVEFVREAASKLGLPFVSGSADVGAHAASRGLSIEEAARELRYRFLFSEARRAGAGSVAVGHTSDDQAETVLMHFVRGAGLSGLKGMPPLVLLQVYDPDIPLVRPFLDWTRVETEEYCRQHGLSPRFDPTNRDTRYFRNRLRHELLPILEQYNPQIRKTLSKSALALQGDHELLQDLVDSAWKVSVKSTGNGFIEFERAALAGIEHALIRQLMRKAAFQLRPLLRDVDFEALERAASLHPVEVAGGLQLFVEGGSIFLAEGEDSLPTSQWPQVDAEFSLQPGTRRLSGGWLVQYEERTGTDWLDQVCKNNDPYTAWLDADLPGGELHIRGYRAGDKFEPLGMPGQTVKLADLFINLKIPRRIRAHWPLVCSGAEIAWVTGLRLAHGWRVSPATRRVIKIEFTKQEGQV